MQSRKEKFSGLQVMASWRGTCKIILDKHRFSESKIYLWTLGRNRKHTARSNCEHFLFLLVNYVEEGPRWPIQGPEKEKEESERPRGERERSDQV